jgi:hypothetical protein
LAGVLLALVGAIAYLVVGEKRLWRKFTAQSQDIKARYDSWLQDLSGGQRTVVIGFVAQQE